MEVCRSLNNYQHNGPRFLVESGMGLDVKMILVIASASTVAISP